MLDGTYVHWTRLSTLEERKRQWAEASPGERVKMLVALLRDLPPEHEWYYAEVGGPGCKLMPENADTPVRCKNHKGHCGSAGCGIGSAQAYFGSFSHSDVYSEMAEAELGMTEADFQIIFWGAHVTYQLHHVTPHDVADALERWAATGEARLVPTGGAK